MSDKEIKHAEPFVPGRDERIGHREPAEVGAQKPAFTPDAASAHGSNGSSGAGLWKMLTVTLLLGMVGMGGVIYQQEQRQEQRQAHLRKQFDDLQYRISSTDESLSQSGATLSMKLREHEKELKKHFSEIDKLWAARNANKKDIDEAGSGRAELKKQITAVAGQAEKAEQDVAGAKQSALAVRAEMEELQTFSDTILSRLDGMEHSLKQWQIEMNGRVAGNEEAIRAIDSFRRQTNQEIQRLKQRVVAPAG